MGDLFGHTQASETNQQLGRHNLDMNERKLNDWSNKTLIYKQLNAAEQAKQSVDDEKSAAQDIAGAPKIIKTTQAGIGGVSGIVKGTYRGLSQGESVASSIQRGGSGALKSISRVGGAAVFGEGSVAAKDLGGVEGIVGNALSAGGGTFAEIGAKGVGNVGAAIDVAGDIDNFIQTGNIFHSKNADGSIKKATTGEDVGNIGTIVGAGLDILAAFTGGALIPLAAAANIAIAGESTVASVDADRATDKKDAKNPPPLAPPRPTAAPAFAQLGFLSNQSHDPLQHISG